MTNPTKKNWKKFYPNAVLGEYVDYNEYFYTIFRYITANDAEILEVGSGPGQLLTALSLINKYQITASDINKDLVEVAKKNVTNFGNIEKVSFQVLDTFKLLEDKNFKDKHYDAITHYGLVEHFKNMDDVKNMLNIQAKKAKYVIFGLPFYSKRNRKIWDRGPHKVYRSKWLYDEWEKYFKDNFNTEEVFYFDRGSDNLMCVIKGDLD